MSEDRSSPTHIRYVSIGLAFGFQYGFVAIMVLPTARIHAAPAAIVLSTYIGGALTGLILYVTRDWTGVGRIAMARRWAAAFLTAAIPLAIVLRVAGPFTTADYALLVGISAFAGYCLSLEVAVPMLFSRRHRPLAKLPRGDEVLAGFACMACSLLCLLLASR